MPIQQPTFQPNLTVDIANATDPRITNLELSSSDTEVTHSLVSGLKELIIRCRDRADLKISFVSGESSTKYFSIPKGTCLNLSDLDFTGKDLFIQSPTSSITVEIIELY